MPHHCYVGCKVLCSITGEQQAGGQVTLGRICPRYQGPPVPHQWHAQAMWSQATPSMEDTLPLALLLESTNTLAVRKRPVSRMSWLGLFCGFNGSSPEKLHSQPGNVLLSGPCTQCRACGSTMCCRLLTYGMQEV